MRSGPSGQGGGLCRARGGAGPWSPAPWSLVGVQRLIARGQKAGELRTDAPRSWLIATYYALLHAAAEEVSAGRLRAPAAGPLLASTIAAALAP